MEILANLYRFNLGFCESLMEDVAEDEMVAQPSPDVNPPAWILGHLAVVNDAVLDLLGQPKRCPEAWGAEFGPQSDPLPQHGDYPSRDELMTAVRDGFEATIAALDGVDLAAMTDPNPVAFIRKPFPTVGDLIAHILTTHAALHLGHLSNWRRQMGRPPLF